MMEGASHSKGEKIPGSHPVAAIKTFPLWSLTIAPKPDPPSLNTPKSMLSLKTPTPENFQTLAKWCTTVDSILLGSVVAL